MDESSLLGHEVSSEMVNGPPLFQSLTTQDNINKCICGAYDCQGQPRRDQNKARTKNPCIACKTARSKCDKNTGVEGLCVRCRDKLQLPMCIPATHNNTVLPGTAFQSQSSSHQIPEIMQSSRSLSSLQSHQSHHRSELQTAHYGQPGISNSLASAWSYYNPYPHGHQGHIPNRSQFNATSVDGTVMQSPDANQPITNSYNGIRYEAGMNDAQDSDYLCEEDLDSLTEH